VLVEPAQHVLDLLFVSRVIVAEPQIGERYVEFLVRWASRLKLINELVDHSCSRLLANRPLQRQRPLHIERGHSAARTLACEHIEREVIVLDRPHRST